MQLNQFNALMGLGSLRVGFEEMGLCEKLANYQMPVAEKEAKLPLFVSLQQAIPKPVFDTTLKPEMPQRFVQAMNVQANSLPVSENFLMPRTTILENACPTSSSVPSVAMIQDKPATSTPSTNQKQTVEPEKGISNFWKIVLVGSAGIAVGVGGYAYFQSRK